MHCFSKERESYSHVGKLIANTTYHGLGPVIGIQWLFGVDRDVGKLSRHFSSSPSSSPKSSLQSTRNTRTFFIRLSVAVLEVKDSRSFPLIVILEEFNADQDEATDVFGVAGPDRTVKASMVGRLNKDTLKDIEKRARYANSAIDRIVPHQDEGAGLNVKLEKFFESL
ncbi:hypothetical protein BU26DRAFT_559598 [Trematosphaeria pertusa]|uniref:Uncharacterized protein n=1 Tax=Trematosphaeria pertusa TaxID=390896 RepID=A0A6A6IWM9_9PLEO|nr:uncharacterized protein BU26DRAFT_559598 [Trematosphaeria pertusa]KAF2254951.1 hypothetical protein BU26DRAFT_559598 [Trematosphaeria pertusa]